MADPSTGRAGRILAGAVLVLAAAVAFGGCTAYLADEGDPAAPVLVEGRIVDASDGAMSGASVILQGYGPVRSGIIGGIEIVYERTFRAGLDGRFVIRVEPTPELIGAGDASGVVRFGLIVYSGADPISFSRQVEDGAWTGRPPRLVVRPDGVGEAGSVPGSSPDSAVGD